MGDWVATVQNKHREVWINYVAKDVFTLRVSSLNYALRCSVVSVSALIWMFEKIIEGWEKRSQTSSSASLMSSQKNDIFAQNSSQGIVHDRWFGMLWMLTWEHSLSISRTAAHTTQMFVTSRRRFPSRDLCVFTLSRPSVCFHMPTTEWESRERSKWKDPSRGVDWGVNCGVKWRIHQNSEPLPKPHLL